MKDNVKQIFWQAQESTKTIVDKSAFYSMSERGSVAEEESSFAFCLNVINVCGERQMNPAKYLGFCSI